MAATNLDESQSSAPTQVPEVDETLQVVRQVEVAVVEDASQTATDVLGVLVMSYDWTEVVVDGQAGHVAVQDAVQHAHGASLVLAEHG